MADGSGLPKARLRELLQAAGERAAAALHIQQNPLTVSGDNVRVTDVAGLLRVSPTIELEIVPKFLSANSESWQEDFFLLALLSKHGSLLGLDRLRALTGESGDLATLIGRALVEMYWDNHRRPIRTYRKKAVHEFALDGDFDPEKISLPADDGYEQITVQLTRQNGFNAAIFGAASDLIGLVRDPQLKASLRRVCQLLSPQGPYPAGTKKRLPTRSRRWQGTYDLAHDVQRGLGLNYGDGHSLAPGFIVDTWRVWEDLVTVALRSAFGGTVVTAQRPFTLGQRSRSSDDGSVTLSTVQVKPDVSILLKEDGKPPFLLDAKYKGRIEHGLQHVSEADTYEALAFMTASKYGKIILCYPKIDDGSAARSVGEPKVIDTVAIGSQNIIAVDVEIRGISQKGGLRRFSQTFANRVSEIAHAI
jgi:hypothetical protein